MTTNLQQLIAFSPFLIVLFTVIAVVFFIAYNRNHCFVSVFSSLGLISSLSSLYFLNTIVPIDINCLFYINNYSIFYIGMIIIASISTCIFAYPSLLKYPFNKEEFYLLILISTLGAMSLIISNHMASFLVSIELTSLPIFGLIGYSSYKKQSLEASFKYVILSGVTSSFLLLGIAWVYSICGSLNFISINKAFNILSLSEKTVVLFGISMILLSLLFKLSIVPFHLWTPDVYEGTPALVLSFFSTVGKIATFYVLLNLLTCFSISDHKILYFLISLCTIFSMLFGNLMALFQKNFKRFLGYSSISQMGYLFIVLLVLDNNYIFSLEASTIYLFAYLFSNIVCFGIIDLISSSDKKNDAHLISSYQGLFWSHPILSTVLTLVLLSLAGIPITLGFIGKFYILSIIVKEHLWMIGFSFLVATLLGVYCYLRVIITLYSSSSSLFVQKDLKILNNLVYTPSKIVIVFSGLILLILGIYPNPLISLLKLSSLFE
ncbi:NADH-quinone oxidoreductase subunit N [Buchnera aphidicola (Brachycaudus cardui)]|uniref:NADH-quinone oxidoreductase subunit N n=1 Tax=Buchnera aphidicola (Brachycaudus cardui) TaxID=557993 RepID=A0A4D6Y149_9GAMM|nr:NADH-quinone oxidoreductase subunit N [Buchnera aphidicola]QCI20318.1 NADH-quinone oxidoreductase subunit N [Buchnera aphidicola (Brachycaudus cardui)]